MLLRTSIASLGKDDPSRTLKMNETRRTVFPCWGGTSALKAVAIQRRLNDSNAPFLVLPVRWTGWTYACGANGWPGFRSSEPTKRNCVNGSFGPSQTLKRIAAMTELRDNPGQCGTGTIGCVGNGDTRYRANTSVIIEQRTTVNSARHPPVQQKR